MQHSSNDTHLVAARIPWNKGKVIGAKPPLQTKHVWSIPPSSRWTARYAISHCPISRSTAN
jgi:hypothetical protein